jgi:diguanylate cyclase (GGDEF)-like protein
VETATASASPYPIPANESERLALLQELAILDTAPEPLYDDVAKLAAAICGTPIAIINFVDSDRQWGKALVGLDDSEAPREASFCARTIVADDGMFIVSDALNDPYWSQNQMVTGDPNLRFYAGASIVAEDLALGTVCVADREPRELTEEQLEALRILARQTAAHLELRRRSAQLESMNDQLHDMALADSLTGLPNRTLLFDRLDIALRMRARSGCTVGVVFIDLDHFKSVNDTLGHQAGDELLRAVASRLRGATRDADTVARVGGDEFVIVYPELPSEASLDTMTARLVDAVQRPVRVMATEVTPELSIGCVIAGEGDNADSLLKRADELMYQAKRSRR